jgi:transcriptional regulator with XRE-family HTH domain
MPTNHRRRSRRKVQKRRRAATRFTALRALRKARGLTQEQMADLLDVQQQTYSRYESGALTPDDVKQVRIAAILSTNRTALWPQTEADR